MDATGRAPEQGADLQNLVETFREEGLHLRVETRRGVLGERVDTGLGQHGHRHIQEETVPAYEHWRNAAQLRDRPQIHPPLQPPRGPREDFQTAPRGGAHCVRNLGLQKGRGAGPEDLQSASDSHGRHQHPHHLPCQPDHPQHRVQPRGNRLRHDRSGLREDSVDPHREQKRGAHRVGVQTRNVVQGEQGREKRTRESTQARGLQDLPRKRVAKTHA